MKLPWDLEATPLQIKTDSTVGSDDWISVSIYDSSIIANVRVMFNSPMQYRIGWCTGTKDLLVQPPVEVEKIWTFTKTGTALIIACNNVDVLNYLFVDGQCATKWGGDVVEEIIFSSGDKASDFYKAGKI